MGPSILARSPNAIAAWSRGSCVKIKNSSSRKKVRANKNDFIYVFKICILSAHLCTVCEFWPWLPSHLTSNSVSKRNRKFLRKYRTLLELIIFQQNFLVYQFVRVWNRWLVKWPVLVDASHRRLQNLSPLPPLAFKGDSSQHQYIPYHFIVCISGLARSPTTQRLFTNNLFSLRPLWDHFHATTLHSPHTYPAFTVISKQRKFCPASCFRKQIRAPHLSIFILWKAVSFSKDVYEFSWRCIKTRGGLTSTKTSNPFY